MLNKKTLALAAAIMPLCFINVVQAEHIERVTYTDGSYKDVAVGDPIDEVVYITKCYAMAQNTSFIGIDEYRYYSKALHSAILREHSDATKLDLKASRKKGYSELSSAITHNLRRSSSKLRHELEQCYSTYMEVYDVYDISEYQRKPFKVNPFYLLELTLSNAQEEVNTKEIAPWFEEKVQKYCFDLAGKDGYNRYESDCRIAKYKREGAYDRLKQRQKSNQQIVNKLSGYKEKLPKYCETHGSSPICWELTYDNLFFYSHSEVQGAGTAYKNWLKDSK